MSSVFCCESIKPYKGLRTDQEAKFAHFVAWSRYPKSSSAANSSVLQESGQPTSTVASPNVYEESAAATNRARRANSLGGGRVKQLVAQYEARSQRSEESVEEPVRRTRELSRPASGLGDNVSDDLAESVISESLAKLKLETIVEEEEPVSPSTAIPEHREPSISESISDSQEEDVAEDWYKVNKTSDLD
ncbi:hypothetical protein C8035_v006364 [Colletotrichum spinosum]|uniref:Uncharacterized protein n=1 Tax=Colletotrichum spinosum TaxID=1347390 RepID=A0A4R8QJU1_9PEZI|nr:hypothetical protein C8035_v006364 [Colletotrichum spinosum]